MADVEIRPGIITHDPFFVAPKPTRDRQTLIYKGDADWCHVSFPPVHPWLYVVPGEFQIGGENDDGTRHRDLAIYIQTDNPAFPRGKASIETAIKVVVRTPGGIQNLQIPVYLRNIQPIPDFEGVFAMDFGTTSTCCAYIDHHDGSSTVQTIKFEDLGWRPRNDTVASMLYFNDATNASNPDYEIGFPAVQMWTSGDAPITAFKYSVKRYLGTQAQTFVLNNRTNPQAKPVFYSYEQLAQFVVSRIISRAEEILKKRIRKVVATYPTTFSTPQFRAVERVFQNLGYAGDGLNMAWDEANAATLSYFYEEVRRNGIHTVKALLPSPAYVLTFDFGGGTTDITVIKVEISGGGGGDDETHSVSTDVIGVTGDKQLGGDNVTLEIFRVLKARVALHIAEAGVEPGAVDDIDRYRGAVSALRDEGDAIRKCLETGKLLDDRLARIVNDVLPTRYSLEGSVDDQPRRHFYELWDVAELLKKKFGTRDEQTQQYPEELKLDVPLPKISEYCGIDFSQVDEVVVKKNDYEARLAPVIRTLLERAKRLLPDPQAGYSLAILAGNSSNLPIVRSLVREVLDMTDARIHFDPVDAKIAVAKGACFARRNELVPNVVKYELGSLLKKLPWDVGCKVEAAPFEQFFPRGTELPTTAPFVYKPKFDVKLLPISARLSTQDEPEAIGYFDFGNPDGDKDAAPMPAAVKKGLAQAKPGSGGDLKKPLGKGAQASPPITVWIDEDRRIGAEKGGKLYSFKPKPEVFPPEHDPFSGVH